MTNKEKQKCIDCLKQRYPDSPPLYVLRVCKKEFKKYYGKRLNTFTHLQSWLDCREINFKGEN